MTCKSTRVIRGYNVPCMACPACKATRAWKVSARIAEEIASSERTWWCTYTLAEEVSEKDSYRDVQLMVKRLRKGGHHLRYAFVPEWGQAAGRLHFHAMIHCENSLTKRQLEAEWPHGFTRLRMLKGRAKNGRKGTRRSAQARLAKYIAKYVTKQSGRFRFSQGYGSRALREHLRTDPLVAAVQEAWPGATVVAARTLGIRVPWRMLGLAGRAPDVPAMPEELRADRLDWLYGRGDWRDPRTNHYQTRLLGWDRFGWTYNPDTEVAVGDVDDLEI